MIFTFLIHVCMYISVTSFSYSVSFFSFLSLFIMICQYCKRHLIRNLLYLMLGSYFLTHFSLKTIRIYYECEGGIERYVPRITIWHHKACPVMTNGDPEGRIFLSYPHTNNGFFFLLTTVFIYSFIYSF